MSRPDSILRSYTDSGEALTQSSYRPSQYSDERWEIIGTVSDHDEFLPLSIEVVETAGRRSVDPMFEDYGGTTSSAVKQRFHAEGGMVATRETEAVAPHAEIDVAQLDHAREEGFLQGIEAGKAAAAEEHEAALAELKERLNTLLSDLATQLQEEVAQSERHAIDFCLSLAHKMVGHAVEINPEYVVKLIHDALSLCGAANIHKVRVSPEDLEFIEVLGVAKSFKEYDGSWAFVADDTIRAGCVVETSAGEVDHRLDTAWERVKDNVVKVLR